MYRLPPYEVRPREYNTRSISDIKDWGHQLVNPDLFWEQGFKGEGVVVFVIDTGIDDSHPDLKGKVIHRKDFTNESPTNYDVDGHGTWCASRISANENDEGVIGIVPNSVLADLRVINIEGFAETEWIAEALIHMMDVDLGRFNSYRRVASMSLGGPVSTPALKSAVKYVYDKGGIIIAAAGNAGHLTGKNTMSFPAKYEDHVIAVGALDPDGKVAKYSSIGEELDVTAPGTDVLGAFRGGYAYLSGTSMATPHIAGVVALLISKYGDLITSKNIEAYLQENAKDLLEPGWDMLSGFGSVVMSKLNEGPRVEIPIDEEEKDQEVPKGCALPSSAINAIEKTKAMYGRGKHIWDNWGKKDKQPYKESLSTKEVRIVKDFITNKHKMRKQMIIEKQITEEKKWYQSSNFWTNVVMIAGVLMVGFPVEAGIGSVAAIFAIFAGGKAIREYLKTGPKVNWLDALKNSNFWNYIATILVAIVPGIPTEVIDASQDVAENLISGNWQAGLIAAFSLFNILFNIFKKKPEVPQV